MVDPKQNIIGQDATLFEHISKTGKKFYITVSILAALVLWGVYAYVTQYRNGLAVTGLSRQHQRELALAVKRARELALLPYVGER